MKDLDFQIKKAANVLLKGGIVAFPTETVMGLGVVFDNQEAYCRLNLVKRRPPEKPFTLMLAHKENIKNFAFVNKNAEKIIEKFCPGPITLLLPVKEVPNWVTNGSSTIGIRVPDYGVTLSLLKEIGRPLLVPSANKSGEKPSVLYKEVQNVFGDEIDYIIEEDSGNDKPSTILDLTKEDIKIVRQGSLSLEDIIKAIGGK